MIRAAHVMATKDLQGRAVREDVFGLVKWAISLDTSWSALVRTARTVAGSAVGHGCEGSTNLLSWEGQGTDSRCQKGLADRLEVIERRRTWRGDTVLLVERYLCGDATNGAGDRRY